MRITKHALTITMSLGFESPFVEANRGDGYTKELLHTSCLDFVDKHYNRYNDLERKVANNSDDEGRLEDDVSFYLLLTPFVSFYLVLSPFISFCILLSSFISVYSRSLSISLYLYPSISLYLLGLYPSIYLYLLSLYPSIFLYPPSISFSPTALN